MANAMGLFGCRRGTDTVKMRAVSDLDLPDE
jgi:hypothetical protein